LERMASLGRLRRRNSNVAFSWLQTLIHCEDAREVSGAGLWNQMVALYFSASWTSPSPNTPLCGKWCPPCQYFVPILAQSYQQIRDTHGAEAFEVILVPLDVDETLWQMQMAKMPWLSVPLKNREVIVKLFTKYCITEAPRLIVLDSAGTVISENARGGEGGWG
ncbi:unnamed protein product, partial [Effrenium voratum]